MRPIEIRNARAADAHEITEMIGQLAAHHNDVARITVEDLIVLCFGPTPWMSLLIVEQNKKIVGYVALQRKTQL